MTGAGLGYASMFSLVNATRPAATKTARPSNTIARRARPNATMPFSTIRPFVPYRRYESRSASLAASDRQHVAEKDRAVGGGQFTVANAIADLPVAVALTADR